MQPVRLICNTDHLSKSDFSQSITAPIYFSLGDRYFPDEYWSDFPVVIVGWWLQELGSLITNRSQRGRLIFMDGPYSVRFLRTKESQKIRLNFAGSKIVVPISEFNSMLQGVASKLLSACDSRGWQTNDINELRKILGWPNNLQSANRSLN